MGSTFTRQDGDSPFPGPPEKPYRAIKNSRALARAREEHMAELKAREARQREIDEILGNVPGRAIGRLTFERMHRNLPEPGHDPFYQ